MKPTQTKYLLGAALVLIWGLLLSRIYGKYAGSTNLQYASSESPLFIAKTEAEPFSISTDTYRDPFLENTLKQPQPVVVKRRNTRTVAAPKALLKTKPIKFPMIAYKGHILSKSGHKAAVLKVNKDLINLSWGEKYQEISLLQIYEDSIRVGYKGVEKTILKGR